MDNKKEIIRLETYIYGLKNRLSDKNVPEKHKNNDKQYREFLQRDIIKTESKILELKGI